MSDHVPPKARMPFGKQFSPTQVNLTELLEVASQTSGNCDKFQNAILERYFKERPTSQATLAMNTRLAMQQYGILDRNCTFTNIGSELFGLRHDPAALYAAFARHILLCCHGNELLQAARILVARGVEVTAPNLAEQLERMGIDAGGRGGEKLNPMRLWLEEAGVFRGRWEVDESKVGELLGLDTSTIDALTGLTLEQRAFISALARLPDPKMQRSSADVARLAEQQSTVRYDVKQLPKKVLFPLYEAGLITVDKTTTGRGAKPYLVSTTEYFVAEVIDPLIKSLEEVAAPLDPQALRRPLAELLNEVRDKSATADQRGKALEGVALQIAFALHLQFTGWRKRASETGGAEVDLTAIQENGRFVLWQIQCKVSSLTSREPVDREVGVAQHLRSNVIALITAGTVGDTARKAAEGYMKSTGINIIFFAGSDLDDLAAGKTPSECLDREFRYVRRARQ